MVETSDHAQVDKANARILKDNQVSRMKVGMEKAVAKNHLDNRANAQLNDFVFFLRRQNRSSSGIRLDAPKIFHAEHISIAVLAIDFRKTNLGLCFEICRERLGIVRLKTQVHFVQSVATEFVNQSSRLIA